MNKNNTDESILSFPITVLCLYKNVLVLRKYTMKDLRDKGGTISNLLSNVSEKYNVQICAYGEKMIEQTGKM